MAGLLGRPESVRALGALAAAGSTEALEKEIQAMHEAGHPVFRGGQRPGLPIKRVAGAVQELGTHAVEVPLALTRLRASPRASSGTGHRAIVG